MGPHNICLYKEVDKKYTGCNHKTMDLLDCAFIGVCVADYLNRGMCGRLFEYCLLIFWRWEITCNKVQRWTEKRTRPEGIERSTRTTWSERSVKGRPWNERRAWSQRGPWCQREGSKRTAGGKGSQGPFSRSGRGKDGLWKRSWER